MAQIPADQKFHTLNANTPTQERGSAQADGLREIYTMQDIIDSVTSGGGIDFIELGDTPSTYAGAAGQAAIVNATEDGLIFGSAGGNVTIKAKYSGSTISNGSRIVYFAGYDSASGLPLVESNNGSAGDNGSFFENVAGIVKSASSGDIVDVLVYGEFEDVEFGVDVGATPSVGKRLYSTVVNYIANGEAANENYVVGTIATSNATFVTSFPGFFDVYRGRVVVGIPRYNATYVDGTGYTESQRSSSRSRSGTVLNGEIVKFSKTGNTNNLERWDVSAGDTVEEIVGIATTGKPNSSNSAVACFRGKVALPVADFPGYSAGDVVYSDATNSYEITSDPTSGIRIGIVVYTDNSDVYIDVNPATSPAGGATEGEKLDFTVRSDAYAATGDHEGTDLKIGGAAGVTAGTVYYWNGDWAAADNTAVGTSTGMIAVATDTGTGVNMLKDGIIQLAANPAGASAGDVLYVGTSGALTITAPTGSGEIVRVAGHTIDTAGLVYFNPSQDWLEII